MAFSWTECLHCGHMMANMLAWTCKRCGSARLDKEWNKEEPGENEDNPQAPSSIIEGDYLSENYAEELK